ncbi:MAG: LPXTG cell wall anchor domain-containing protein [Actinomycetes bacterium]
MNRIKAITFSALVASAGISASLLGAVPAHAAYPPDPACLAVIDGCVEPTTTTIPTDVLGEDVTRVKTVAVDSNGLPVTGGDVVGLLALGGAAAIGGGAMVRLSRRNRNA